jgi:DNA end-binding protein Ku
MKAVWRGTISFGLVSIPVKMYTATTTKEIKFNMLHSRDGAKIHYRKICEQCGNEVTKDEIVKGYEVSKNEYVILSDEDFSKIPLKTVKNIEINQFFDPVELNIIYYNNFYYLSPEKGGEKAYCILKEVMNSTNSMGIGKVALRNRERLIALKSFDNSPSSAVETPKSKISGGLLLAQLHYIDEIRSPAEIPGWDVSVDVSEEELELAKQLLYAMKKPLRQEEYRDEYKEGLIKLIEAKMAGKEVSVVKEVKAAKSLVDALKSSLAEVQGSPSRSQRE